MKKVIGQFLKFGIVGAICFIIDLGVSTVLYRVIEQLTEFTYSDVIGSFFGFSVSVIVNYILSMKFVFERREDMGRKKEFTIFVILSVIGLGLNLLVIWFLNHPVYDGLGFLNHAVSETLFFVGTKIVATAIVTVWNFVSRKIFIEKKNA